MTEKNDPENPKGPKKVYGATDIIIEYNDGHKEGIVLIERLNPPYGFALPGGILETYLSPGENAVKEAKEETNLEVIIEDEERPFLVKGKPDRDPRARVVSLVYIAKGTGTLKAGDDAKKAGVYTTQEIIDDFLGRNPFAFDHEDIIKSYLQFKGYSSEEL